MAEEIVEEDAPYAPRTAPNGQRRRVEVETIGADGTAVKSARQGAEVDEVPSNWSRRGPLKESTEKLLAKLDSPVEGGDPDDVGDPDDPDKPVADAEKQVESEPATDVVASEAESATEPEPPKEEVPELGRVRSDNERLARANRELVAELEGLRKQPKGEPSGRDKALDEIERLYLDDSIGAIRKLIALTLGVDDATHRDVDAELSGLYTDLTARELNVPLDQSHKAAREAARAKQMLARDKRERKAESEARSREAPDEDARQAAEAAAFITSQLSVKDTKGSSIADEFPRLMNLSERLDGMAPSALLWRVIRNETQAGNLDPKTPDDQLIRAAARIVEDHYRTIGELFAKVQPAPVTKTDTAKQGDQQAANAGTASKDQRQGNGARTITQASASVAPATSPAKKSVKQEEERPKFKSDKERRDWALRHLPT